MFTCGLVNFIMNFWTSQRSSERSSQHSRKSYMKSTVIHIFCPTGLSLKLLNLPDETAILQYWGGGAVVTALLPTLTPPRMIENNTSYI